MSIAIQPPKTLLRLTGRAIADFSMIRAGDNILLGLSGGKDSLSLLHVLLHFQRHAPIAFKVGAVTVDPQARGFDPAPLVAYLEQLGIPLHYRQEPIFDIALDRMTNNSYCSFCARMKRGVMYDTARREGYNVIALAQHLDDLAESFLMSAFNGGRLQTMKAHYRTDDGDLRVIRPFVYVRERQTTAFAHENALPVILENCPACVEAPTERARIKLLLAEQEKQNPQLFKSLKSTLRPLMEVGLENTENHH